jgi:23S rRNA pseudouridine2605 synthase
MSKNHKKETKLIRLQKYIADCGVTSRRKAEELILEGHVKVNGVRVTELGTKVEPQEDVVEVRGQIVDILSVDHMYVVVNKPRGYMTTVSDPEGRKTIMDLVKAISTRIFPVGRLDYLSEGLILMTNDGDMANKIMHPSFEIEKTYEVKVFGKVNEAILKKLRKGTEGHDGLLRPKSVRIIEQLPNKTWLEFRLNEGKNREIRRICEAAGITIDKLKRVAIGGLSIDGIKPGDWSYINKPDLLRLVGINKDGTPCEKPVEYFSPKKSIDVKKVAKNQKMAKLASDKDFNKYKKETYYGTLKLQKEMAEKREEEKRMEQIKNTKYVASFEKTITRQSIIKK